MTLPLSRRFITHSGKLGAVFIGFLLLLSCAGGWGEADRNLSAFSPEIMGQTRFQPFFFTLNKTYYDYNDEQNIYDDAKANITDWSKHFKDEVNASAIQQLIYTDSLNRFKTLSEAGAANDIALKWMQQHKDVEAFEYLKFAQRCQLYFNHPDDNGQYWDNTYIPVKDSLQKENLFESAVKAIGSCKSDFIRLRYAYQIVRLACYNRHYKDCIEYYDKYIEPIKTNSVIKYWALSIKARALYKCGAEHCSKYCYAIVFDRCNTRRKLAKQGFWWAETFHTTDAAAYKYPDKPSAIDYCKDRFEKMPVYALMAFDAVNHHVSFLDSIYSIEPKSDMLEWLLVRGINQFEYDVLPGKSRFDYYGDNNYWNAYGREIYSYSEQDNQPTFPATDKFDFAKFVGACADANNTRKPDLWNLSAAYLHCVNDNYAEAKRFLLKVNSPNDSLVNGQKSIIEILVKVRELKPEQLTTAKENELADGFKSIGKLPVTLRLDMVRSFLLLKLSATYALKGDKLKATLCQAASSWSLDLTDRPRNLPLDEMIAFAEKKDKTPFELLICSAAGTNLNALYNVKGTVLLSQYKFKEAIAYFSKTNLKDESSGNPFTIHICDCHDCDFHVADSIRNAGQPRITFTKLEMAKVMLELENKAATAKGEDLAQTYFALGNGMYNMTSYGNSWMISEYPFAPSTWDYMQGRTDSTAGKYYQPYYDCSKAKELYNKAMLTTHDKEFAAQCCFMIAKCDQNKYYDTEYKPEDNGAVKIKYRDYFKLLKKDYSNTKFYEEALNECAYFNDYVAKY